MLTAIVNTTIVSMDAERRIIKDGAILIEDDRIIAVGTTDDLRYTGADRIIEARGKVAIPGLINAHTHMFQALLRGLGDDKDLIDFLTKAIYPIATVLTAEDVYAGALLSCVEAIKSGTTCIVDNHTVNTSESVVDNIAKAYLQTGMRGLIARGLRYHTPRAEKWGIPRFLYAYSLEEDLDIMERLLLRWQGEGRGMVSVCPAPVTIFASGPHLFTALKSLYDKYGTCIHTHVAESRSEVEATLEDYGMREIQLLHSLGVLGPRFHVVHGVWLSDEEIALLAESGGNLIHCPVSNMFLASGVARLPEMLRAGINIALGSDGAANNNQDMFGVMKTAALLHKVHHLNPTVTPCEQVFEMATLGGAKTLGMEAKIGSLEPGKKADIVLVDLWKAHTLPIHRVISALVYCANGSDVDTVVIDGRIVMEGRRVLTVDEGEVLSRSESVAEDLIQRAALQ
ncbi:MAG: amidohydrolase [Chloroflexi bacterium]|nr:amidohydrolase [Chloroflexota bacterium]MCL5074304.1 amidohydrolase [Chloroflexota bacterium]